MKKNKTLTIISQTTLIFVTLAVLYPLLFLLFTSLKSNAEFLINIFGWPKDPQWNNYPDAWSRGGISLYFMNSVAVSVTSVLLTLIFAIHGGYALAKMHIPKSEMIILTFLVFIFIPPLAIYIALYKMMAGIRLTQSLLAMILPYTAWNLPVGMLILKKSFEAIPTEILESARIDGCGELRILIQVVLPLVTPAVATVTVLTYIRCWEELMLAQIVTSASESIKTLPIGLLNFRDEVGVNWGQYTAGISIVTIPPIAVFAYFQKYFISGLTRGSIKG